MANRSERINRAVELVKSDPSISKRLLQSRLKAEYGVGLSDTARREVLQKANTPAALRAKLGNKIAFTRRDSYVLRKVLHRTGATPYLAKAINDRYTKAKELRKAGKTVRQIRREVKEQKYIATKTTATRRRKDGLFKGQVDWWRMLRDYRDKDISRGDYVPLPKKKPSTDKGKIKKQKSRYDEKQSKKSHSRNVEREKAIYRDWIKQLDQNIEATTSPARRRQLIEQKKNVESKLRRVR